MSLEKEVECKVEVLRNNSPVATLTPLNINVTREVTEALGTSEIECSYNSINGTPQVGDNIKIFVRRKGDTYNQIFYGDITRSNTIETGKDEKVIYYANELPVFNIRTVTISSNNSISLNSLITDIVSPLVTDNIISLTISPLITNTVSFEGVDNEPIFSVLQDVCLENTLDFYLDFGRTLHLYRKIDSNTASYTFDQSNPNAILIKDIEFVEDLENVRNNIVVYGDYTRIEPNNETDYWTESTVGWSGILYKTTSTISVTPQTVSPALSEGNYYILFDGFSSVKNIERMRCTLDLNMEIDVSRGGQLVFTLETHAIEKSEAETQPDRWGLNDLIVYRTVTRPVKARVELRTSEGWLIGYRDIDQPEGIKEHKLNVGVGTESEWLTIYGKFKERKIGIVVFEISVYYIGKGNKVKQLRIGIDKLYFGNLQCYASYSVTDSINKYGLRPYERETKFEGLTSNSLCLEKAIKIIDPIAYPEKSIRSLTVDGNKDITIGEKVNVRTDRIPLDTYYIRKVEHDISDLGWTTVVTLSKSLVLPVEKSREKLEVKINNKIRDLEKRVKLLEGRVGSPVEYELPKISPPQTLDFENTYFDWDSILGVMSPTAVSNILSSWTNLADGMGQATTTALNIIIGGWNFLGDALGNAWSSFWNAVSGNPPSALTQGGTLSVDSVTADNIQANAIDTYHLRANIIETQHLKSSIITTDKIAANAIETQHLKSSIITADKIQANAIYGYHITAGAIDASHIQAGAIQASHIAASVITATHLTATEAVITNTIQIATALIQEAHIADAQITTAKIQDAAITNLKIKSGVVKWDRVHPTFRWTMWSEKGIYTLNFEGISGYRPTSTESGSYSWRKNDIRLTTGTTAGGVKIRSFPILTSSVPFKTKVLFKLSNVTGSSKISIGLSNETETQYSWLKKPDPTRLYFADFNTTVYRKELGFVSKRYLGGYSGTEVQKSSSSGVTNTLRVKIGKYTGSAYNYASTIDISNVGTTKALRTVGASGLPLSLGSGEFFVVNFYAVKPDNSEELIEEFSTGVYTELDRVYMSLPSGTFTVSISCQYDDVNQIMNIFFGDDDYKYVEYPSAFYIIDIGNGIKRRQVVAFRYVLSPPPFYSLEQQWDGSSTITVQMKSKNSSFSKSFDIDFTDDLRDLVAYLSDPDGNSSEFIIKFQTVEQDWEI